MNLKDVNVLKILKQKYAIVTKDFPLEFDDGNENSVDNIEEAHLYSDKEVADKILQNFDEADEYQVIKVDVTYEF